MKFVIQRVKYASCKVDEKIVGSIDKGFLVFIGITDKDDTIVADKMIKKLCNMRIFEDENGKTNLSLNDVGGSLLLISQFTLYSDMSHGNRPSFINAAKPDISEPLYNYIVEKCKELIPICEKGIFGADMKIELLNDGPFTIVLDSNEI